MLAEGERRANGLCPSLALAEWHAFADPALRIQTLN
jgi:hypothetical protein